MSIPILIMPEVKAEIARVRAFAEDPVNRRTSDNKYSPGGTSANTLYIPTGFKVAYSVDEGASPGLWFRHLSVSVTATGGRTSPSPAAMDVLTQHFGFTGKDMEVGLLPPDPDYVVHALEPFEEGAA